MLATLVRLAAIVLQYAVLLMMMDALRLENESFRHLAKIVLPAFVAHHFLPAAWRLPFFALFSMATVTLVFGAAAGTWLLAAGLLFVGAVHLRIGVPQRIALVLALGACLAPLRAGWIRSPLPPAIWPILGSMFMFRLAVYLYDLRHRNAPAGLWRALAYFFMVPNACFPLFPVVDYETFCRTHYNDDPLRIYQTGMQWIFRGALQLVLYRVVYQQLLPDPAAVADLGDVVAFLVFTYLLYLRISGLFHLIVGMLHLFGFNLPETNHRYLLASSFTDFWRRINIYWKDFIMKIIYYPLVFRWKRWGTERAMVAATAITFLATWLLHSYQWFWTRGTFPLRPQDGVFWMVLALLVAADALREYRFGRARTLKKPAGGIKPALGRGLRTALTFGAISLLWSVWTCDSLEEWASIVGRGREARWDDLALVVGVLVIVGGAGALFGRTSRAWGEGPAAAKGGTGSRFPFWRSVLVTGGGAALVVAIVIPGAQHVPAAVKPGLAALRQSRLNPQDAERLQRGYYEGLVNVERFNSELGEVLGRRPADWKEPTDSGLARKRSDYRGQELVPGAVITWNGTVHTVNRWGMRDRDYEKKKPEGVYRIALIGSSREMGWGVGDDETYENIVEDRLNERGAAWVDGSPCRIEILNFGVPGYEPVDKLMLLDEVALEFDPDVVIYAGHHGEPDWLVGALARAARAGPEPPFPFLTGAVARAGVDSRTKGFAAKSKLQPYAWTLVDSVYRRFTGVCRDRGLPALWIFVPSSKSRWYVDEERKRLLDMAGRAGFKVFDISNAFEGVPASSLFLTEWDQHPNRRGHQLLAEALLVQLTESGGIPWSARPSSLP